jgi:transposase
MGFQELTDEQRAFLAPLRPPRAKTGRPRVEDRKVLHGILCARVAGCRWRDRPRPYGGDQTAWRRFQELQEKGVWHKILPALPDWGYTLGKGKVGGGGRRFHAGGGEKGGEGVGVDGRKRRKGTKARVWVNEDGLPLSVVVGPGDEHEGRRLEEALEGLRVKKSGRGCGGGGFGRAFRRIRGGGRESEGESGRSGVGGLIGRLEAAWRGRTHTSRWPGWPGP